MHPMCPADRRLLPGDDWEVVNEPAWPIHQRPAEELGIALQEANPYRAQAAVDHLRAQTDRRKIDCRDELDQLLSALGDCNLNRSNPAAAVYVQALVSLKEIMSQPRFVSYARWPEEQVAKALKSTCPKFPGRPRSGTNEAQTDATTRWISRVTAFTTAGLVKPSHFTT